MPKSKRFRPTLDGKLEDRVVPSHLLGLGAQTTSQVSAFQGDLGSNLRRFLGGFGLGGGGDFGGIRLPGGVRTTPSSTLAQDARQVQQTFQSLNASFLSAVATLRQTATTTTPPTQAGLDAYNGAIASAITNLNSTITSALGNLTNTGSSLVTTLKGYTSTLQTELQSAGSGLANSTNQAVLALRQEGRSDIRSAQGQATSAILNDQPSGGITSTTLQTYNQAVSSATQTFRLAISNAVQTSITGGTKLDSTAVSSAVSTLQGSLTSAINGLGTAFTSSTYNPTSTVNTQLTTLQNQLLAISAPTAGNTFSGFLFSRTVSSVVSQDLRAINLAVSTAIQNYNNTLV
jgi:hypothetical protein